MPSPHVKDSVKLFEGRDLDLYSIIFETVTKNREAVQETARTCKQLFKKEANSYVLTRLEELFKAGQDEQTIKKHLESSEQGASSGALAKLEESVKRKREDYEYYTQHFLKVLKTEIESSKELAKLPVSNKETEQLQGLKTRKEEILKTISDILGESIDKSYLSVKIQGRSINVAEGSGDKVLTVTYDDSGSDSGVSSSGLSEKSLESPVSSSPISVTSTSSQESLDSTLSSAEEDDNPQIEETKSQVQPGQTVERVKENENSDGRADRDIKDPVKEKPQPGTLMADGHSNPLQSEEKNRENATVQEPSVSKNNRDSNGKSSPVKEEKDVNSLLYETIRAKVTKEKHKHPSPQIGQDRTLKKCIELFEQVADPNELIKLEKFLSGESFKGKKEYEKYHKYYIENFLPALLREVSQSKELKLDKIKERAGIISGIIKQSLREEEYEHFQRFLSTLEEEITKLKKLNEKEKKARNTIIMELKISDDLNKIVNESHPSEKIAEQSTSVAEESGTTVIPELNNGNDSDSGVSSSRLSEDSSKLLMDSRRSSVNSILSSAEEDNGSHKEETEDQMQSEQTAKKEPEVSFQRVTLESREKESWIPVSSTGMTDGHSNPWQSEEKKDKENASVKKPSANENNGEGMPPEKQSNNRDLYKGFATGCAGLAVGCLIAGIITLGAGLFVMAAVFAIAAIATRYLTPPSSELTSTTLSPLVDAKQR